MPEYFKLHNVFRSIFYQTVEFLSGFVVLTKNSNKLKSTIIELFLFPTVLTQKKQNSVNKTEEQVTLYLFWAYIQKLDIFP